MLSQKVSGTTVGMWLLIPEMQRLGVWDLLKGWTGGQNIDFDPRIALQLVNESALCINRVRKKNSLGHQGFQLANGMGRLVTDEQVHNLLNTNRFLKDLKRNFAIIIAMERPLHHVWAIMNCFKNQ
ncbi:hypothetical protein ES708_21813 [subsurface metagenome]